MILYVIVGEQKHQVKSKNEIGKDPEWKQNLEFKITNESSVLFVVATNEKNGFKSLGVAAESLYHVSHTKQTEKCKLKLFERDVNIGFLNFEMTFKEN